MVTRTPHHTGWAGALAVAAELSRRGYDAAITLGNTPALDFICSSPEGATFKIQVKSSSSRNWIRISLKYLERPPAPDLLFAVVLVPTDLDLPFAFHILRHDEVCALYAKQSRMRRDGTPLKSGHEGIGWSDALRHAARWDKLPS